MNAEVLSLGCAGRGPTSGNVLSHWSLPLEEASSSLCQQLLGTKAPFLSCRAGQGSGHCSPHPDLKTSPVGCHHPPVSIRSAAVALLFFLGWDLLQKHKSLMAETHKSRVKMETLLWITLADLCAQPLHLAPHPVILYHHNQRKTKQSSFFPPLTYLLNLETDLTARGTRPSAMLIYN